MRNLSAAQAQDVDAANYPQLGAMYLRFAAETNDDARKALLFDMVKQEGLSYRLEQLEDMIDELRAWQCLVLFLTEGLFGQDFTREQVTELTGADVDVVHATCGSVKFIRARSRLN